MNEGVTKYRSVALTAMNWLVLVLSLVLIVYISVEIFDGVEFIHDGRYMRFQLWVCVVFMGVFFAELLLSDDRWGYLRRRWLFLLLSVPYLNILRATGVSPDATVLYFLRFVPLSRGALALSIVVGYVSKERINNIFASYVVVLVAFVYFGSLIFYEQEHAVNVMVPDYASSLWWACSNAVTTGCDIYPVTAAGKVVSAVLSFTGTMMFPLFTVVITTGVRRRLARRGDGSGADDKAPAAR